MTLGVRHFKHTKLQVQVSDAALLSVSISHQTPPPPKAFSLHVRAQILSSGTLGWWRGRSGGVLSLRESVSLHVDAPYVQVLHVKD